MSARSLLRLAAPHRFDEIHMMRPAAITRELLELLVVIVVGPTAAAAAGEVPVLALDDESKTNAAILVLPVDAPLGRQSSNLVDQRDLRIVVVGDLGVGSLPIVIVTETAAQADHAPRKVLEAEDPAAIIQDMAAEVADFAGAGGPAPMPVVVQVLAHEGSQGSGALEQTVVTSCRNRLRAVGLPDALAQAVGDGPGVADLAQTDLL